MVVLSRRLDPPLVLVARRPLAPVARTRGVPLPRPELPPRPYARPSALLLSRVVFGDLHLELLKELLDRSGDAVRDLVEVLPCRLQPYALEALVVQCFPVVDLLSNAARTAVVVQVHELWQVVVDDLGA